MTVFELHLEIDQKLQEQGSYQRDRIFPEAKDLALNEAMKEILLNYTDVKFADREKKMKAVEPLLVKNLLLPTYPSLVTDSNYEQNARYSLLPPDFLYGVNYRAEVLEDEMNCDEAPTVTSSNQTEYIATVAFPTTALGSGPYFNGFKITRASGATIIYSLPAAFNNRFQSTDQKYEIVQNVLDTLNQPRASIKVYWERYRDQYSPNSFILSSTSIALANVEIAIFATDGTTPDANSVGSITTVVRQIPDRTGLAEIEDVIITNPAVKLMEPEAVYKARLNSFTKTKPREPHGTRSQDILWIYQAESFIITAVGVDYIRKPKTISLALGSTCELDPSVHHEVVDRAIEILKLNIQDPSADETIQYNSITTRK